MEATNVEMVMHGPDAVALLQLIKENHTTSHECLVYADMLEEAGRPHAAFAFRWMGWHGKRPGLRRDQGNRILWPYAWYSEERDIEYGDGHLQRQKSVEAWLPAVVFAGFEKSTGAVRKLYKTWEDAALALSKALRRVRACVGNPSEKLT